MFSAPDTPQLFEVDKGQERSSHLPEGAWLPSVVVGLWIVCPPDVNGVHRYCEPKTDAGKLEGGWVSVDS